MRRAAHISWPLLLLLGGCCPDDAPARPPHPAMVEIPAGAFTMGSPEDEPCRDADEPRRQVTLSAAFELAITETTQASFERRMGYNPSFRRDCPDCPVDSVSWHEAAAYCNALTEGPPAEACYTCTGAGAEVRCAIARTYDCPGYRLPTEAEWEKAARAGATTPLSNGAPTVCMVDDPIADASLWYKANSGGRSHPVMGKVPNAHGLWDMEGNVYEWVQDTYSPAPDASSTDPLVSSPADARLPRVFRGGSWYHNVEHARLANRDRYDVDGRFTFLGFRCARTVFD